MRCCFLTFLLLAPTVPAATVSTTAYCYRSGPWNSVIGTYYAACAEEWTENFGNFVRHFYDSERAEIHIGSSVSVQAGTYASSFAAGEASARFSAQYLLTLTGASNLLDPTLDVTFLYLPCLVVSAFAGRSGSYAYMGSAGVYNSGNTCGATTTLTGLSPVHLNVPLPLQLDLNVYSGFGHDNIAQFTGEFRFFSAVDYGPVTPLTDATYTLILNDALPLPEPGSLPLTIAGLLTIWAAARRYFLRKRSP